MGDFDLTPECTKMSRPARGGVQGLTESLGLEIGTGGDGDSEDSLKVSSPV